MPVLAALATVPGREEALRQCLASLRPQVDEIRVVCHDMETPPPCVVDLADGYLCEPDTRGSAAKLHWARDWKGIYLGCDDDWVYPANYATSMMMWVKQWQGKALVVGHGRVLAPKSTGFTDVVAAAAPRTNTKGMWLNYPGCCALAFDTTLQVPNLVPGKNLEEVYLAVWAQAHRVPIWLVPHKADWLDYRLKEDVPTIWAEEKGAKFANRNAVIQPWSNRNTWVVNHV